MFYSRRRITIGFGTATTLQIFRRDWIYSTCFHAQKAYSVFKLNYVCIKVAQRKPKYNLGMLYALVRLRLVSRVFV